MYSDLKVLGSLLTGYQASRVLVVSRHPNAQALSQSRAAKHLTQAGVGFESWLCGPSEPASVQLAQAVAQAARECQAQAVVGIGDGGIIDLSKAAAALAPQPERIPVHEFTATRRGVRAISPETSLPFAALPTTATTAGAVDNTCLVHICF